MTTATTATSPGSAGYILPSRSCSQFRLRRIDARLCCHLPRVEIDGYWQWVDRCGLVHYGRLWPIGAPPNSAQIEIAADWLDQAHRIATPNQGSYGLKHCAERWAGQYISNGAFLVAVYRCGFAMQQERWGGSCNARVGISTRWLRTRPESSVIGLFNRRRFAGATA